MAEQKKDQELEGAGAEALRALQEAETAEQETAAGRPDKDPEEVIATLSEAQLAQILDRGVVNDRLRVTLPPDRVGYWVRERSDDIERYKALGGRIEKSTDVGSQGLHGAGDDRIRVGDVILMSLPRHVVDAIAKHDEKAKQALDTRRAKDEFLRQQVKGVPHYEEA